MKKAESIDSVFNPKVGHTESFATVQSTQIQLRNSPHFLGKITNFFSGASLKYHKLMYRMCRLNKFYEEERKSRLILININIVLSLASVILILPMTPKFTQRYRDIGILFSFFVFNNVCLIFHFFVRNLRTFLFLMGSGLFATIASNHYWINFEGGMFDGVVMSYASIIPLMVIYFDNHWHYYLWIIIIGGNVVGSFVKDLLLVDVKDFFVNGEYIGGFNVVFYLYFGCFFPVFIAYIIIHNLFASIRYQEKIMNEVGDCIFNLKSPNDLKLMKKPENRCIKIERIFQKILKNFEIYLSFLPQDLKVESNNVSDDTSDGTRSTSEFSVSDSGFGSGSLNFTENSSKVLGRSGSSTRKLVETKVINLGFSVKEVVILIVKFENFYEFFLEEDPLKRCSRMLDYHKKFCERVSEIANRHNGVINEVFSDYVIISWNAVSVSVSSSMKATACSFEIYESFKTLRVKSEYQIVPKSLIFKREMLCGRSGSKKNYLMKFMLIDQLFKKFERIFELEELRNANVIMCGGSYVEVSFNVEACKVLLVSLDKENIFFYKIFRFTKPKEDEWLYVLPRKFTEGENPSEASHGSGDNVASLEVVWDQILIEEYEKAKKMLKKLVSLGQIHSDDAKILFEKLEKKDCSVKL